MSVLALGRKTSSGSWQGILPRRAVKFPESA